MPPIDERRPPSLDFLVQGGGLGALMAERDWSDSPLGPPQRWSQSLKTTVGLMLGAEAQIVLFWGERFAALYNDAYVPSIGDKHPRALGRPAVENWTELWDDLGPLLTGVFRTGRTFAAKDRPFYLERHGGRGETAYFDVSYSAVPEADGSVGGVLCIVSETTERVRAVRELQESEARLRFLGALDEALRRSQDARAAMRAAAELLATRLGASRCAYAAVDADTDAFTIHDDYAMPGLATSAGSYSLDLFGPRAAADMRGGRTLVIRDVAGELDPGEGRETFQAIGIEAIVCCPLVKNDRLVAMMAVHQVDRRDWQADEIALVETVVERCWAHVERVGAETRLRASEARFRTLADAMPLLVWTADAHGRVDYYNARRSGYAGLTEGVSGEYDWAPMVHPDDLERTRSAWSASAATGSAYACEHRLRRADGRADGWADGRADGPWAWHMSRAECSRDEAGAIAKWYGTAVDIAELKAAQDAADALNATLERRVAERTAERNLLATIVETTDAQVQVLDLDFRWLAVNSACARGYERLYGRRPRIGESLLDLLADRPEQRAAAQALWARALAGEAFTEVGEFGDPAFERRAYEMKFEVLRDADGRQVGAFLTGTDVTERLRGQERLAQAEEALRQAQKMEAVGQLTGGVAHDFNNLLTIIRSSVDLLRRPDLPEERRTRYMDAVAETVERAAKLTGQLLAFARRQALKPEVFEVGERLRAVADMLDTVTGARIRIVTEVPDHPCFVLADRSQFETALVNMAVNARDAMEGEGTLTIRLACGRAMPPIRGHGGGAGPFAAIALEDTGSGIEADRLGRIFEPFYTTKEPGKGTGLGLSQVFGFAKQSGGDVDVYSAPGQGSAFTLYLPEVKAEAPPALRAEADAVTSTGAGQRVLVVEDNVEVGRFATQLLADLGYATVLAADAEEALDRLGPDGDGFAIVFSDVMMPGMDGVSLAKLLRHRLPHLPVLLTSGYSDVLARQGSAGFDLLHKPYAADELGRELNRVIRDHRRSPASAR